MKEYLKELNKRFGYRPTWEPGKPLELGDIGVLEKGVFSQRSSLMDLGISFEIREPAAGSDIKYASSGGVKVEPKLSGKAPLPDTTLSKLDSGFSVSFSKENAILFEAKNARTALISNLHAIEKEVIKKMKDDSWKREWVIISELMQTDSATIVISKGKSAKIELKAAGEVATGELHIADVDLGLKASFEKNIEYSVIAQKGSTPFYRASGIKNSLFSLAKLATKGLKEEERALNLFEEVPFSDKEFE